jgi:soluble lytic murein transglycosylase-like protein
MQGTNIDGLAVLKAGGRYIPVALLAMIFIAWTAPTRVLAEIYYTTSADGTVHFSTVPTPGALAFVPVKPLGNAPSDTPRHPTIFRSGTKQYDELVARYAEEYRVDPALVRAVIRAESGFNRHAVSPKGARGLMQLMPATARQHGCVNAFDADDNVHAGVAHLRQLLDEHGNNLPRALAAYNAGSGAVVRHHGIPPYAETTNYVAAVLRYRRDDLRRERIGRRNRPVVD